MGPTEVDRTFFIWGEGGVVVTLGITWSRLVSLELTSSHLDSLGLTWSLWVSLGLPVIPQGKGKPPERKGKGENTYHDLLRRTCTRARMARHEMTSLLNPPTSD